MLSFSCLLMQIRPTTTISTATWAPSCAIETNSVTFEGRVGYKDAFLQQDLVDSHWSFGTGIEVRVAQVRFGFDYAYVPFDFLSDTQMVDFRVYF